MWRKRGRRLLIVCSGIWTIFVESHLYYLLNIINRYLLQKVPDLSTVSTPIQHPNLLGRPLVRRNASGYHLRRLYLLLLRRKHAKFPIARNIHYKIRFTRTNPLLCFALYQNCFFLCIALIYNLYSHVQSCGNMI